MDVGTKRYVTLAAMVMIGRLLIKPSLLDLALMVIGGHSGRDSLPMVLCFSLCSRL